MLGSLTSRVLFALSLIATTFASDQTINVPLTDPSIVLGGNTYYNGSLCGGSISLPDVRDSLAYSFNGSEIQLDFVAVPGEYFGNFTVSWPEDAVTSSDYPMWWSKQDTLNCSIRGSTIFSTSLSYQLNPDHHTVNLTNAGGGGIFVVGISYLKLPDSPASNPEIPGSEHRAVLSFLGCLAGYLRHRYLRRQKAKKAAAGSVEKDGPDSDASTIDQKQAAAKPRSRVSRWLESLMWASS
ncbi:hypothetical protein FRC01_007583 [Tulasnella sp. 417]|nr:hypothetical protein FRC01_007583 [Tulasnella sp. 417]